MRRGSYRFRRLAFSFALLLIPLPASASFARAQDLFRVHAVGSPSISPDGTRIVYTVREVNVESGSAESSLWMASWDGGNPRRMLATTSVAMLQWAPDGKRVAFVMTRDGKQGLWILTVDDGRLSAVPTAGKHGPFSSHRYYSGLQWSPDGRAIVFAAQGLKDPDDPLLWKDWYRTEGFGNIRRRVHLWTADVSTGAVTQITSGDFHHGQPTWSPDGRQIAFMANRGGREEAIVSSTNEDYDIWVVPATGGEPRKVTRNSGPDINPVWSPDGRSIAYTSVGYQGSHGDVFRLHIVDVASGDPTPLTGPPDFDYSLNVEAGHWIGERIFFTAGVRGTSHVFSMAPGDTSPRALTTGDRVISSVSVSSDGQRLALLMNAPLSPPEVWVAQGDGSGLRQVTTVNAHIDRAGLATTERVRWRSEDGMEIEGLVVKPAGFQPGRKYPLVVRPHGGPHGASRFGFSAEYQVYASQGYVSFAPNFRGSSDYGQPFLDADRGNLGGGDFRDLMSGVDHLIALGYVDPERLAITGSSYGGFLTAWAIGHTDRFKVAMAGAPVVNAQSFFGTSDIPTWVTWEYYGPPWQYPDLIRAYSPISYVQYAKTPTLITHGEDDVRVPLSQGFELYRSLKTLGVPTELVIYPGERHGFTRPEHQIDRLRRTLEWFARYLGSDSTGQGRAAGQR
jgi:dipeptidyl aminopeptidase/acylaminoacyl peptidase